MTEKLYPALQLTDACNKRCRACLRVPGEKTNSRRFETIKQYIGDIERLTNNYKVDFQFVTGGEPTLWKEKENDVGDIIILLSGTGNVKNITMPTNGKRFEKMSYIEDLFQKISNGVDQAIIVGISIADYQDNFINGRCKPLENLLAATQKTSNKIFPVALVTLMKQDDMSVELEKAYPDIIQRITPLAPLGAGEDMMTECPSFSLSGNDKSNVGSFLPQFTLDVTSKLKISKEEFFAMKNSDIMNQLSLFAHCGNIPFVDETWHYCLPFKENSDYDLARIGDMTGDTINNFLSDKPFLKSIRTKGVLETVNICKDKLSTSTREKVEQIFSPNHQVSVAYRGCMICKEFAEAGVWNELIGLKI